MTPEAATNLRRALDKLESFAAHRPVTELSRAAVIQAFEFTFEAFWKVLQKQGAAEGVSLNSPRAALRWAYAGGIVRDEQTFLDMLNDRNVTVHTYDEALAEAISSRIIGTYLAALRVELLPPLSGLDLEEPLLQAGRIEVLLGQGQTGQVLRNVCLAVHRARPEQWQELQQLMRRLFAIDLGVPGETARGAVTLTYRQQGVHSALDLSCCGRGALQMLSLFAYLYAHPRSVLLVDEPDAHLEVLRQRQVYVLLREVAHRCGSQVVLATHSEVILEEAVDKNVSLLVHGGVDDLVGKTGIRATLRYSGAQHYLRARERGYVLYVEGSTDIDMLRALAVLLAHPVARAWDERINAFYLRDGFASPTLEAELARIEAGEGRRRFSPTAHFHALRHSLPHLRGLGILDGDGRQHPDVAAGGLRVVHWRRYEAENYFVTPQVLRAYVRHRFADLPLFAGFAPQVEAVLDELVLQRVFRGSERDLAAYHEASPAAARLVWETRTEGLELSDFAESFFRQLARRLGGPMLLTKGSLHHLVAHTEPSSLPPEIAEKLDLLAELFTGAVPSE